MKDLLSLYRKAEQLDIPVLHLPLPQNGSMSLMGGDGRCWIGMDCQRRLPEDAQRVRLAHELGHCVTGSFYSRSSPAEQRARCENRADRYAIEELIPAAALDAAVAMGITEPWELAEHFGVDQAFLRKALSYRIYGNLASELYF